MREDSTNAEGVGGVDHPHRGVAKQRSAEASALVPLVDGETSNHDHRDRIGRVPSDPPRRSGDRDRP
jgi:hypothetical protein